MRSVKSETNAGKNESLKRNLHASHANSRQMREGKKKPTFGFVHI